MFLKEVTSLPKEFVKTLKGNLSDLSMFHVMDYDLELLKRIVDFSNECFYEIGMDEWGLVPQIRHGNVLLLKEKENKSIVGVAVLMRDWTDLEKAYLIDYAVHPNYQNQGIGYHFLKAISSYLIQQGFSTMSLTVDRENKPALYLYKEKIGFEVIKYSEGEYGEGNDRNLMELDLNFFVRKYDTIIKEAQVITSA